MMFDWLKLHFDKWHICQRILAQGFYKQCKSGWPSLSSTGDRVPEC
jgi:hypothetical protein